VFEAPAVSGGVRIDLQIDALHGSCPVLSDEVSIRVEELLIISTVEAIAVDADRISVPQLEPYAL
jgi:hypothetical protein